jgi:hypothetical protein
MHRVQPRTNAPLFVLLNVRSGGRDGQETRELIVRPWLPYGTRRAKVAFDGEIVRLRTPLTLRVSPRPLHLMLPREAHEGDSAA